MDTAHRGRALAELTGLLADRTRATFCLALLDGRAWTPSELARHAGVAPSTTTEHLNRLVAGGLLVERRQGRHRYVELASPATAALLEDLVAWLPPQPERPSGLRAVRAATATALARTCYDHLAGTLGVSITESMLDARLLDTAGGLTLTPAGREFLVDVMTLPEEALRPGRRPVVRGCLDWTERRTHLAGGAGAALCGRLLAQGWIRRVRPGRAVRLTAVGAAGLHDTLGLDVHALGLF
ncbi:DNA-binding transcriptional ArsR family regulator [Actinoalloteichus hoggarensis]|uniref:HTH-type transcriptional regulator CmtR n=1 Tax=Actinoalloteichus hoggarensis TaxID=1470176 RepID=A0A221W3T1_9PSEU|nr:winged helix-turn-helix domain-containing protein [Actinoalloteichus hoggarensis]ASO20309.1 HTH-type transcriptional regulator CmtR [Actinoalloteichus hoggarensis]MBB5918977.1 DNA-binding transcriptional ArsR family regulator [Actinoalloteichus hoggarensis]